MPDTQIWQTFSMLVIGVSTALLAGAPLGVVLFMQPGRTAPRRIVNTISSIPCLILLAALAPLAGVNPAVPLSTGAIACFARLVERQLRLVPHGVIDAARAHGASPFQLVTRVLVPEARSGLITALALLANGVLAASVALRAGAIDYLSITTVALLALFIQFAGQHLAGRIPPN